MDEKIAALFKQLLALVAQAAPAPLPAPLKEANTFDGLKPYSGPLVEVRPTGVRANGVVRVWPVPPAHLNYFGYVQFCSTLLNPQTGLAFVPEQYRARLADIIMSAGYAKAFSPEEFPWHADCFAYPEDWQSQAQIDQAERDQLGWVETHRRMQGVPVQLELPLD